MCKPWRHLVLLVWFCCAANRAETRAVETSSRPGLPEANGVFTRLSQLQGPAGAGDVSVRSVRLDGVVTWVSSAGDAFILQDESGAVRFAFQRPDGLVKSGRRIRLEGEVALGGGGATLRQILLVNNDGEHFLRERSARQTLKAGRYGFHLDYFQGIREMGLKVAYEGPGIPRQEIPASALFQPAPGTNPVPGVRVDYYEGKWNRLPDFSQMAPTHSGSASNLAIIETNRGTYFALRFTGAIQIPADGEYRFHLTSDDGSRFWLDAQPWRITAVGPDTFPAPQTLAPGQLLAPERQFCWSEIEGTVKFPAVAEGRCQFDLVSGQGRMRVEIAAEIDGLAELLANSRIRVRGACGGSRDADGNLAATELFVPGFDQVSIERLPLETWQRYPSNSIEMLGRLTANSSNLTLAAPVLRPAGGSQVQPGAITPIESIRLMNAEELEHGRRVRIRGVVITDRSALVVTVHDGEYGISCWSDNPGPPLEMGDYVEVEGVVRRGAFGPNLGQAGVTVLGRGLLPVPLVPTWNRLINGSLEQQWVEIEGLVQHVQERVLTIAMTDGPMEVELVSGAPARLAALQDAIVRIRGAVTPIYNSQGQIQGVKLWVSSPLYIFVETPARSDPFAAPLKRLSELTRFDPGGASSFYQVKIHGQVVYADATQCHLLDGSNGLRFLPKSEVRLAPGDWVDVVGFPELGGGVPLLREALARKTGPGELPPAEPVSLEELLSGRHESRRVRVEGTLVNLATSQQTTTLEVQMGPRVFTARLQDGRAQRMDIPLGSLIRLTGVCVSQGRRLQGGSNSIESLEILLSSPADVVALKLPPWWTVRRIMVVVGLLAAVLSGSLAWIYLLHRKVDQRTAELNREMKQRKEAELQRAAEQERSRIARDLHDDLGSSLTEIGLLAGLGLAHVNPESANDRFGVIAGKARSLVNSLDVIVWAADPEEDDLESFADYLSGYARMFLESSGIPCRFKVPIELPPVKLDGRIRHDLFLAVKETLNNIVRHARATAVEFGIRITGGQLEVSIADNGCGFDSSRVARGNGLTNLEQRLAGLGGTCQIESGPGQGTRVKLTLDLKASP